MVSGECSWPALKQEVLKSQLIYRDGSPDLSNLSRIHRMTMGRKSSARDVRLQMHADRFDVDLLSV